MRCEAGIIHLGKPIATAKGKVMDSEGRLYAHGVSTCMIFSTDKALRAQVSHGWFWNRMKGELR